MKGRVFGITDVGRRRQSNEDQYLVDEAHGVYAVADGMGGHAAGEVASRIAIDALADELKTTEGRLDSDSAGERVVRALHEGNRRICDTVMTRGEWRGMGTTIVVMVVAANDFVVIGHVGDSRAYRLRQGALERLTDDHSYVAEQVRMGLLTDEEAHKHPLRNIVTRAMGNRLDLEVELNRAELRPGDLLMLCSDGLNTMLGDDEIARTLSQFAHAPEEAARRLVEQANERGGDDNITVIVATIDE